ncbi:MAG: Ig-like domain-containing protein [Bacteroidales bacterium]|nr:Ig-like domain-containing protein [Bacteroidales bacterium]
MKTFKFIAALCGVAALVCSCEKEDSKTNKVASITLSATELKLAPEEEAVLTATFAPEDADLSSVVWASSAEAVATVSPEGKVKAVAEGETTVSVTAGDVKAECKVVVEKKKAAATGWAVGDYYEVGNVKGVVVWVDESKEHGKIISLDEKVDIWATGGYNTGAKSEEDGKGNTDKVKDINAELSAFPAFKWCVAHGEGWYFPAIMEVYYFLNAKATVNSTLEAHNGTKISDFYWSSTEGEEDETAALYGYLKSDGTATSYGDFKENPESDTLVRAMYQF